MHAPDGPAASPLLIDDRFELLRRLGEGGQAVVVAARDRRLGVDRALKVLLPEMAARPKLRARFESEARTLALLDHPHIVRVHDVIPSGRTVYTVMDYIPGGSLQGHLSRHGPLEPRLAVSVTLQICSGLSAAHAAQVIHRDIKPHNVLLARDGSVKIVDFGIARTADGHRTRSNAAMGTLGFVAPEQLVDARSVDGRADVFGTGMTLFVLLTGADPSEWLRSHHHPRLPRALEAIVERATAEKPEDRYPTIEALAEALQQGLPSLGQANGAERTFAEVGEAVESPAPPEEDEGPSLEQIATWFQPEPGPPAPPEPLRSSVVPSQARPRGTPTPLPEALRRQPTQEGKRAPTPIPAALRKTTPGGAARSSPGPQSGSRSDEGRTPASAADGRSGGVPASVGYTMSRPTGPRGAGEERPEWIAEEPAETRRASLEVQLQDQEREASEEARARSAEEGPPKKGAEAADPEVQPQADATIFQRIQRLLVRALDLLGKLPLGIVGPVSVMFALLFGFLSYRQLAEERAARELREKAEAGLNQAVVAQLETAQVLASVGADPEGMETLVRTFQRAETEEERVRLAGLLYSQLRRDSAQFLFDGSSSQARVQVSLKALDAAIDQYRATHPDSMPTLGE